MNTYQVPQLNLPTLIDDIVFKFAKLLHPDMELASLLITVLAMLVQTIGHKRICFDEYDNGENVKLINFYGINIGVSGSGKDRLRTDLEDKILKPIISDIQAKTYEYTDFLKTKVKMQADEIKNKEEKRKFLKENEVRNIEYVLFNGTAEGFYADCKAISKLPIGNIICIIPELGLFLNENDDRKKQLINMLYPAYDGEITTKSIKSENRENNLKNVGVNILLYSDPTIFKDKYVGSVFDLLLQTGLARRSFVSFQECSYMNVPENGNLDYEIGKNISICTKLRQELQDIFNTIPNCAKYALTKSVSDKSFYPYKKYIAELHNNTSNPIIQKEIKSRILKSLKMATFCACINHPKHLYIEDKDFIQGISITEFLSKDFVKFYDYMNKKDDRYDKFYYFLLKNLNKTFKKTHIVNEHYKEFGFKREDFRGTWIKTIEILREMAEIRGYKLLDQKKNGYEITLTTALNPNNLHEQFKPIDEIIK